MRARERRSSATLCLCVLKLRERMNGTIIKQRPNKYDKHKTHNKTKATAPMTTMNHKTDEISLFASYLSIGLLLRYYLFIFIYLFFLWLLLLLIYALMPFGLDLFTTCVSHRVFFRQYFFPSCICTKNETQNNINVYNFLVILFLIFFFLLSNRFNAETMSQSKHKIYNERHGKTGKTRDWRYLTKYTNGVCICICFVLLALRRVWENVT